MSMQPDSSVFHVLATTPSLVRILLAGAPRSLIETPVDGDWSAKHVAAHLVDVEAIFGLPSGRIWRIVHEERPFIHSIDPSARIEEAKLLDWPIANLINQFEARRTRGIAYLRSLSVEQMARTGDHDEAGEISAANLAWQWAYHDLMHIEQLCAILKSPLVHGMGNTRKFYDV